MFLDLHGAAFAADPYAELARVRALSWHAETAIGVAVLTHREVQALLGMRELRTPGADFLALQGITDGPVVEAMRGFLLNADGPEHHRVRGTVAKAFTVRRVEAYRPAVAALAEELIAGLAPAGSADFVAAFADPFALRVLYRFVGIPEDAYADVLRWTADIGLMFGLDVATHRERIEAALASLGDFLDELIAERRRSPREDLLSGLVAVDLTDAELHSMIITLMAAGQGTVAHQLGNAMAAFLAHPAQWRLLAERPDLAAAAAEEVVRFCPSSILGVPRVAKQDVALGGLTIPEGALVLPVTGSANRDPAVHAAPDTLDLTREQVGHLTFGGGIHYCLGAALARVELQEALPRLAAALREPVAAGPAAWRPPTEAVYGPTRLPIAWESACL